MAEQTTFGAALAARPDARATQNWLKMQQQRSDKRSQALLDFMKKADQKWAKMNDDVRKDVVDYFMKSLSDLQSGKHEADVAKQLERAEQDLEDVNAKLAKRIDLRSDPRGQAQLMKIRSEPITFAAFLNADVLNPDTYLTQFGMGADRLLDLVLAGTGATPEEASRVIEDILDKAKVDNDTLLMIGDPKAYQKAVDAEVRSLVAQVAPELRSAAGNRELSPAQWRLIEKDLLPTALRNRLMYETEVNALEEQRAELSKSVVALGEGGERAQGEALALALQNTLEMMEGRSVLGVDPTMDEVRADTAKARGGMSPEDRRSVELLYPGIADIARTGSPEEIRAALRGASAEGQAADPTSIALMSLLHDVERANTNPDFVLWRRQRGVQGDVPASLRELRAFRRQQVRTSRPGYRYKRTGDMREVTFIDKAMGLQTAAGPMYFVDNESGEYLTPEQVAKQGAADLKEANVVEFDVSNPDVLERVASAATNSELQPFLQSMAGQEKLARSRVLFDKTSGRMLVLDEKRRVIGSAVVTDDGELKKLAKDDDYADVVGSVDGFQRGEGGNMVASLPDDALVGGVFDVAAYIPAGTRTAEAPKKTLRGEAVYAPGQPANKLALMHEVDGIKQVQFVDILDDDGSSLLLDQQFLPMEKRGLFGRDYERRSQRQAKRARPGDERLSKADPMEASTRREKKLIAAAKAVVDPAVSLEGGTVRPALTSGGGKGKGRGKAASATPAGAAPAGDTATWPTPGVGGVFSKALAMPHRAYLANDPTYDATDLRPTRNAAAIAADKTLAQFMSATEKADALAEKKRKDAENRAALQERAEADERNAAAGAPQVRPRVPY
jgi:hypothetical protein